MLISKNNKDFEKYKKFHLKYIYAYGKLKELLGIGPLYVCNEKFFDDVCDESKLTRLDIREIETQGMDVNGNKVDVTMYIWKTFLYNKENFVKKGIIIEVQRTPVYMFKGLVVLREESPNIRDIVRDIYAKM